MSLFGALSASVAGLNVQSNALGIISDDIANVSTVGYKSAAATFESLVTNSSGTGAYTPGGVLGGNQALVTTQGLLQTTSSPTDIAISGGGLFVTNTSADGSGQTLFTRAGSFTQNAQGNFVNTAGLFLRAWPLDRNDQLPGALGNLDTTSAANLSSLQTVNVQNLAGTASATTTVALGANLNSSQATLAGAGGTATMDALDTANYPLTASDIIVPTGVDSIAVGQSINISTGQNPSGANYVYGGFTFGRNIQSAANGQNGVSLLPASVTLNTVINPLANAFASATPNTVTTISSANQFATVSMGTHLVNITVPAGAYANMYNGQTVSIVGPMGGFDNFTQGDLTGNFVISKQGSNVIQITATGAEVASAAGVMGGASGATITTGGGTVNIALSAGTVANMRTGQYVSLVGPTLDANISSADLTGIFQIAVVDSTHISVTAKNGHLAVGSGEMAGAGGGTETVTPDPFITTTGANSKTVTVDAPANGLANGDVVTFSGIAGPSGLVNGIPVAQLNTSFIVSAVTTDSYQITVATTGATSAGAAPTTGTIAEAVRPYAGNILDADNAAQALLGVTGTSGIDPNALSFKINTSALAAPAKFTYVPTDPNTSIGQFTTLNDLASAISAVQGLTARIINNRLWVSATDATQGVTFTNTQSTASAGPPVLAGVDWVGELGLLTIGSGANRFNSLSSLAALVNTTNGLTASVSNPSATASLRISVVDPTDTITFKDNAGAGSLLSQLGLATSQNSVTPVTLRTVGPTGPAYNPQVATTNMASSVTSGDGIAPQFSYPITIYDGLGTAHSLNVAFAKLQNNTWAVEIYAVPAHDITPTSATLVDGQVATGTVKFNGDGSLENVSTSLSAPFAINWTDGSIQSNITFNWGTAGQPAGTPGATQIGGTNGLSQFDSGYNVSFANQNGAPVGQLTGIAIASSGIITASYSNGETQELYQIPLASFTDPNLLTPQSGDSYAQSNGSGIVNLKQAGQSGVGTISAGALESSNADLASELTDMIVAQRAYQANSKVIQTANSLLSDLDQIIQ